jgi:hypothetical protein
LIALGLILRHYSSCWLRRYLPLQIERRIGSANRLYAARRRSAKIAMSFFAATLFGLGWPWRSRHLIWED